MGLALGLSIDVVTGGYVSAPVVFNPLSTSPVAWYDPSDLSSMFQDTAGTQPAAVNAVVNRINDKSGNNQHLITGTGITAPTLRLTNGFYYLDFDGVSNALRVALKATLPQPYRRMAAIQQKAWGSSLYIFDGGATDQSDLLQYSTTPQLISYAGAIACGNTGAAIGADVVADQVFNGASSSLGFNNAAPVTGNPGAASVTGVSVGAAGAVNTGFASFRLYGMLLGNFTTGQANSIRTYLGAKCGLSL